jgi:hypothetical protein
MNTFGSTVPGGNNVAVVEGFDVEQYLEARSRPGFVTIDFGQHIDTDLNTGLKDGSADEVLLRDVLGNPAVAYAKGGRTDAILDRAARTITDSGVILVIETITPANARLNDERLGNVGLRTLVRLNNVTVNNRVLSQLEAVYEGRSGTSSIDSAGFYQFIGKASRPLSGVSQPEND